MQICSTPFFLVEMSFTRIIKVDNFLVFGNIALDKVYILLSKSVTKLLQSSQACIFSHI